MSTRDQLTKKERREQARQERLEREAAERARQERVKRMWQLGAGLALAVVIVVVAIVVSSSSSGPSGLQRGPQANSTVKQVNAELSGIPQSGSTIGWANAPVTLQYYADLECPVCREFTLSTLPQVMQQDVRSHKLKIQFRSLQTATQDTTTFVTQQVSALAAGKQNLLWPYVELFYHEQGQEGTSYVTESFMRGLAQQVPGLNLTKWQSDRNNQSLQTQVSADEQAAQSHSFNSTPTLVLQGPKGTKAAEGALSFTQFQQLFQQVS